MPTMQPGLAAPERVILAVDTSDPNRAVQLMTMARQSGAVAVKLGLELITATSPEACADMAAEAGLSWVADQKIDDIPNTTAKTVGNYTRLSHPPLGITIHTTSGIDSMRKAQEAAADTGIVMLGVTELTSNKEAQLRKRYEFIFQELGHELQIKEPADEPVLRRVLVHALARDAAEAGLGGLVASAKELVDPIKSDPLTAERITMIPGTRSSGAESHDQQNTETPKSAIVSGADFLVIGRQVTEAEDMAAALEAVVAEVQEGINERSAA